MMKKVLTLLMCMAMMFVSVMCNKKTTSDPDPLGRVQNLKVSVVNDSIVLEWNNVTDAEKYEIYYNVDTDVSLDDYEEVEESEENRFVHSGNLKQGSTYYYKVRAVSGERVGDLSIQKKILYAGGNVPSNVTAQSIGNNTIKVQWNMVNGANMYYVYYSTTQNVNNSSQKFVVNNATFYDHVNLQNGMTYYYKVSAVVNNVESALSQEVMATVGGNNNQTVPSNVQAQSNGNAINVTWNLVNNATMYYVYYGTTPGLNNSSQKFQTNSNSYNHQNLQNGQKYYYRVSAVVNGQESQLSQEVFATVGGNNNQNIPQNVQAQSTQNSTSVNVTWNTVTGANLYYVYYGTTPNLTKSSPKFQAFTTQYTHNNLQMNTTYYYRVSAEVNNVESELSTEVFATVGQQGLQTPQNVTATADVNNRSVRINWNNVNSANGYYVYYATQPNVTINSQKLTVDGGNTTFTNHTGLQLGNTYYYRVVAFGNNNQMSNLSQEVSANLGNNNQTVPQNVKAESNSSSSIRVSWNPVMNATSYKVYYSMNPIGNNTVPAFTANGTYYDHNNLSQGQRYYYLVTAIVNGQESGRSAEVSATVGGSSLEAPKNVAVAAGNREVLVSWEKVDAAFGYKVYYVANGTLDPNNLNNAQSQIVNNVNTTNLTLNNLVNGNRYHIGVVATANGNESTLSETKYATPNFNNTQPSVPQNVVAKGKGGSIELSWSPSINAVRYEVQFKRSTSTIWADAQNGVVNHPTTKYLHENLTAGVIYDYRIRAISNSNQQSAYSQIVSSTDSPFSGMRKIESKGKNFQRGSNLSQDEMPIRRVTFTEDYFIDTTEITQKLYREILGVNPSIVKGDNYPVNNVNWYDAVLFCNARSKADGLDTVYEYTSITGTPGDGCVLTNVRLREDGLPNPGYHLPTEAEWEYACRGGRASNYLYFWSTTSANSAGTYSVFNATTPSFVSSKSPNPYDLYDMTGNVAEWCQDWYGQYKNEDEFDPHGPNQGTEKVLRGEDYANTVATEFRISNRDKVSPTTRRGSIGFRTVVHIED